MAVYHDREKTRLVQTRTEKMIDKNRRPPEGMPWIWLTEEMIFCPAYGSLSTNAHRALWRIVGEYLRKGRRENGRLVVTHEDFQAYGVTGRLIADAIDELIYKGFLRVQRGKSGDGTPHPNLYCLTFYGDHSGVAASNDWRATDEEKASNWQKIRRRKAQDRARRAGRKKKSSTDESEIPHCTFVKSDIDLKRTGS